MRKTLGILLVLALLLAAIPTAAAEEAPEIRGVSAIVLDYETGAVLYEKDADSPRVPASMTKIMTAYIIFEELEAGRLSKDSLCPVSQNALDMSVNSDYPAVVPLTGVESIDVDMLIKLILLPSASASCVVAAEHISGSEAAFVQRMNETAARLDLTAEFENCHGAKPHNTTARSVALLTREFISRFPEILDYTSLTSVYFNGRTWYNTNNLLSADYYEGCDGFKTGTITAAGYCLCATAARDGRRIISVVMKSPDNSGRYSDTRSLLDYGFAELERLEMEEALKNSVFKDCAFHWAKPEIEGVYAAGGVMSAYDLKFRPEEPITRAEFAAMLVGVLEKRGEISMSAGAAFTDTAGHWAERYILAARAAGIVSGHDDGSFGAQEELTREQVMVAVGNLKELPEGGELKFTDAGDVSSWARDAVARGTAAGILRGYPDGSFRPGLPMTRAETAVVIARILGI